MLNNNRFQIFTGHPFFVSSNCFSQPKTAVELFETAAKCGFHGIELSAFHGNWGNIDALSRLAAIYNMQLLVHNYFPPPQCRDFVLNLADPTEENRNRSIDFALHSIEWCAQNKISLYSIHAGFACTPTVDMLGHSMLQTNPCNLEFANEIFISSLKILCKHAQKHGVRIAIENNVCSHQNLLNGKNMHILCTTDAEIIFILEKLKKYNLGLLLDIGHLNVSATTLGFNLEQAILNLKDYVTLVHVHDNDSFKDEHKLPIKNIPLLKALFKCIHPKVPFVLEVQATRTNTIRLWMKEEFSNELT